MVEGAHAAAQEEPVKECIKKQDNIYWFYFKIIDNIIIIRTYAVVDLPTKNALYITCNRPQH